jgi:transcriptional regulator with XRE-family HTH domain
MVKLTPEACRAGRALLGWSQAQLVTAAKVSPNTVAKIEAGGEARAATEAKLVEAFTAQGVEILNGDAPGARLRAKR